MARSWLKIFACGHGGGGRAASDASDEDLAAPEKKASFDRHRWSFWKILGKHRGLINTVTSDPLSVGYNKKSPENAVENLHSPRNSSVPENAHIEKPTSSLPTVNSELVDTPVTAINSSITSHNVEDSVAVVIQAAIRGYFARRDLLKLKHVIKLQAALRGHLVRRQAIGTLRCIQAIIKVQTLVRVRLARKYVKESAAKDDDDLHNDTEKSTPLGNVYSSLEPLKICPSMEKLLSNRFARQMMELTPKTLHIPIKCDSSRSDLVWKWFERWMAVAAPDKKQHQHQDSHQSYHENEENTKFSADVVPNEDPVVSLSSNLELTLGEPALQAEGEEVMKNSAMFEFQPVVPVSDDDSLISEVSHQDQPCNAAETLGLPPGNACYTERVAEIASESFSCRIPLQSISTVEPAHSISDNLESHGKSKCTYRSANSGPLEGDISISRNPSNPVFAAIQSKFEVLSSNNSACEGVLAETESDGRTPPVDSFSKSKDFNSAKGILVQNPIQVTTSERDTEVSISSALDSPDRSEAGDGIVLEVGSLDNRNYVLSDASANAPNIVNENLETKDSFVDSQVAEHERLVDGDGRLTNSILSADASQMDPQLAELTTPAMQDQVEINPRVYMSSPGQTPGSQKTVPESHETPASQVSVNAETGLNDDNQPSRKPRLQLFSKSSPSTPDNNFSARSGTINMHKDSRPGKRRNSFGMSKSDHVDGEHRISSSDSFPGYMRATESTRAKIHACISPKSGPDVQERDSYLTKRHSFPLGNGKHGLSPRIQRSASQTQQTIKGNASRSPHNIVERRWQR